MARLVHPELAATRQPDARQQGPTLVVHGVAEDVSALHLADEVSNVGTHQVELVRHASLMLVHGYLRGRQPEDHVPDAGIDARQLEGELTDP
jgi:hypothetical protein